MTVQRGLLIASPQMKDPHFEGTVVLLCQHDENGAVGVVINRETTMLLGDVLEQLSIDRTDRAEMPVLWGGPVEPGAGFVVFLGSVPEDEGWNVGDGVAVSPARDRLARSVLGTEAFHLCLGYAGWGPGQLDDEIAQGAWLYTEVDRRVILEAPVTERYAGALARLGLDVESVWMKPIDE